MSLLMHKGGQRASLNDLKQVPLPEETESYKPVSHYDLAINLARTCNGLLNGYHFRKSQYGLAKKGNQMFGIHTYINDHHESMGLSIGFRNSYDKSMSVGIAVGASVLVCDNLALTGDIAVMRKHTVNVWEDLEEMIITTIYRSQHNFSRIVEDSEAMKQRPLTNDSAYRFIGLLYGRNVITPRQIPQVKKEWQKPSFEAFQPRNLWSFYNACTEALKTTQPSKIMEKHIQLHELLAIT